MKNEVQKLTAIIFLTIAVLILASFVVVSYSKANEEYQCVLSEEQGEVSNGCDEEHSMMDEMVNNHGSMHMNHHNATTQVDHHKESKHGCH